MAEPLPFRRALITGASSGIGKAFAERLAASDVDVVLVARRRKELLKIADELESEHGINAEVIVADLFSDAGISRVENRLLDDDSPVDLLVNNAGFGQYGEFVELDIDTAVAQVNLNIIAMMCLAHAAASAQSARGRGGIINVSSNASFQPIPNNSVYAATKSFVTSFSEALHEELKPTGVRVTALCPGFTRTEFQEVAAFDSSSVPSFMWTSVTDVVEAGIEGLRKGRAVVIPGTLNRAAAAGLRLTPRSVVRKLSRAAVRGAGRRRS